MHLVGSMGVVILAGLNLPLPWIALLVLFLGICKEMIWDYLMRMGDPDIWDFVADAVGVAIGVTAIIVWRAL
jgi:hypothetical protein